MKKMKYEAFISHLYLRVYGERKFPKTSSILFMMIMMIFICHATVKNCVTSFKRETISIKDDEILGRYYEIIKLDLNI